MAARLRSGKGINLPDTELPVAGLTRQDERRPGGGGGSPTWSTCRSCAAPSDVALVQERLAQLGADDLGIVLKIETVRGFEQLPEILLAAMRADRVGVMIARGDLAVEAGFERLAEVQEEILWLCEAAHVPVIWATQVLDQLARTGQPSRAEITDAAMSARAECVMLNKGPHIAAAITALTTSSVACTTISTRSAPCCAGSGRGTTVRTAADRPRNAPGPGEIRERCPRWRSHRGTDARRRRRRHEAPVAPFDQDGRSFR